MADVPPLAEFDHLYLSPHLDDAVLSCGGRIHQQAAGGQRVLILTLFAGNPPPGSLSPFAESLHARWHTPVDAVAARRAEDRAAAQVLGAHSAYLDHPDCIYRREDAAGGWLYSSRQALFGAVHAADDATLRRLTADLAALGPLPRGAIVYSPAAIGNHVDHQIVRRAAEAWSEAAARLAYYEDYPYAGDGPASQSTFSSALAADYAWLTPRDMAAKLEAIRRYRSQLRTFWPDDESMRSALQAFALRVGGGRPAERLWRTA